MHADSSSGSGSGFCFVRLNRCRCCSLSCCSFSVLLVDGVGEGVGGLRCVCGWVCGVHSVCDCSCGCCFFSRCLRCSFSWRICSALLIGGGGVRGSCCCGVVVRICCGVGI